MSFSFKILHEAEIQKTGHTVMYNECRAVYSIVPTDYWVV